MNKADTNELSEEQFKSARDAFNSHTTDRQGFITTEKLGLVMRSLGHSLRRDQLRDLIRVVDTDMGHVTCPEAGSALLRLGSDQDATDQDSGTIEFEEFLPLMAAKIKEREEIQFYRNLFRMLDKKNKGFIKCGDLRYILQGFAKEVDLSSEDINSMISDIDEDGNGEVSFDEFYKLMTTE